MIAMKRVELVVEAVQEERVEAILQRAGVDGFTLFRNVAGDGHRGRRDADGLTDAFANICFLVAATEQVAQEIADAVQPLLREAGGMCLISDAGWVEH